MSCSFVVEGVGNGGSLALFWNNEIKVQILSYSVHHIDSLVWDGCHHAT
jgi:hypothetical protein